MKSYSALWTIWLTWLRYFRKMKSKMAALIGIRMTASHRPIFLHLFVSFWKEESIVDWICWFNAKIKGNSSKMTGMLLSPTQWLIVDVFCTILLLGFQ